MKISKRRQVLALGGLAAFAAGYSETAGRMAGKLLGQDAPKHKTAGDAPEPEFRIDRKGNLEVNPAQQVSYTTCLGCTTMCGVRVRIDRASGKVLRVAGNPYSPLSTDPHLPMKASVRDSFVAISGYKGKGLDGRSTACGRGNAVAQQIDSPYRVLTPLKRVGPRNSGQWEPISFEQLVKEVVHGGNLFGEGPVDGLAALRDLKTPIDPQQPALGSVVNQVAVLSSVNDGRENFARRFFQKAYGTINFIGHGSYCGGSYRSGSGALFGDMKAMPHCKPDFSNAEFVLFVGTAPGQAGNPFKRQGTLVAKARSEGKLSYVVVDPVLTHADNVASGDRGRWLPIRPGTDGALAMAIIRQLFETDRIDRHFLSFPNAELARQNGEPSFSNATHLVVVEPKHPRERRFLRASDLGFELPEEQRYKEGDAFVCLDEAGQPVFSNQAKGACQLLVDSVLTVGAKEVRVKSALKLLQEEAMRFDLPAYAAACGIPADTLAALAQELAAHGKRASVIAHGGMMSGSGFYNAYALMSINALLGNINWKGGFVANGGGFKDNGEGPRYNLDSFPGMVKPAGTPLGRNVPYEKTAEFAAKKAADKPYPASAPWFPNAPGLTTELLPGGISGYPYALKALVLWSSNPLYGVTGLRNKIAKDLADPKKLPLIISVDPFINESNAYADYIVPDSLMYESWGWVAAWNGVPTKAMSARWPVIEPKADKTPDGQAIGMETFFIALAKAMQLPGFGAGAISDPEGQTYPLNTPEDWYLRGGANIAWLGKEPVADATAEDIILSGVERIRPLLEKTLKPEEVAKVAFLLTRGGRYQPGKDAYDEENPEWMRNPMKAMAHLWNENLGAAKNSLTGKRFTGCATWVEPSFADGTPVGKIYPAAQWPLQLVSYKSALQNPYSIGATRLLSLHPENPVLIHPADAQRLGLEMGDLAEISTPTGSLKARVMVHAGVTPGVAAVEHGFGHRELGARAHRIGKAQQPENKRLAAGVNLNDVGLIDPTRPDKAPWVDSVSGAAVRNGLPARISRA
ncbi:molybdopterin-dependent oxidoreductase [Dechloromonas agitata]|uniref:molybdopterin dinucleotide binding domain-containing protein n=1 Tax=Dechloromonas agitata TaxID=73030 RepID=UPI00237EA456|nr:molybdopterin dinucleotide binding domain-containing protein [Dechloromonas agitata]MDE1544917.1 molybdopterin-dependent oxidoreductase [Dechloromonas agitata]